MYLFWGIILALSVVLEIATTSLITIWFGIGAFAAIIAMLLNASFNVQVIVFLVVSVLSFVFLRSALKKQIIKEYIPTNGELDIGAKAIVIQKIDNAKQTGRIRLNGVDWPAVSLTDSPIPVGTSVIIKKKESNVMFVSIPDGSDETKS